MWVHKVPNISFILITLIRFEGYSVRWPIYVDKVYSDIMKQIENCWNLFTCQTCLHITSYLRTCAYDSHVIHMTTVVYSPASVRTVLQGQLISSTIYIVQPNCTLSRTIRTLCVVCPRARNTENYGLCTSNSGKKNPVRSH